MKQSALPETVAPGNIAIATVSAIVMAQQQEPM
jgi:hypothetical protein